MTKPSTTPRPRVLVAVGPATADSRALAAAAQLAQTSGAEFAALFVEDINLLRLAELPFAFEVGLTSSTPRPLVAADIERTFRNQANQLRHALSELASALQFSFSFEIARGRPAHALLAASAAQDLVVLSGNAARSFAHVSALDVVREALRRPADRATTRKRPVVAVLQSPATAPRVLAAAQLLASTVQTELILLVGGEQGHAGLAKTIRDWLAARHLHAPITLLPELDPESTAALLAENDPLALFWPGDGESTIAPEIDALLTALACPLVIVR